MNGNAVVKKYRAIVVVQCVDCNDFNTLFFPHDIGQHLIFHFFFFVFLLSVFVHYRTSKKKKYLYSFVCSTIHLPTLIAIHSPKKKLNFFPNRTEMNTHPTNKSKAQNKSKISAFGITKMTAFQNTFERKREMKMQRSLM